MRTVLLTAVVVALIQAFCYGQTAPVGSVGYEALSDIEKKYADYRVQNKGNKPILHIHEKRPLSSLKDGDARILKFNIPGILIKHVIGPKDVLASVSWSSVNRSLAWAELAGQGWLVRVERFGS